MAELHEVLQPLLRQRAGFETIQGETKSRGQQAWYFGRVHRAQVWLMAVHDLLQAAASEAARTWTIDISKQYFLRGGKLFFGWRIIIQSQKLGDALPKIAEVLQRVQPVVAQAEEVSLHVRADRNALRNGRGAQPTMSAVVGPLAKANLGM